MTYHYPDNVRPSLRLPGRGIRPLALLLTALLLTTASGVQAQQQNGSRATITPNYKDADLAQITEAVSAVTGKTFIIDPRVKAQVTMLSSTPMSPNAFYEAFLSILQVHGYVAVPAGNTIKIIPDANARQVPGNDLPGSVSSSSDELVTQVIAVRNVSAAQLVPILRPLIPQYGQLAAYSASNMLIITDRANNVNRMMRIIERIDRTSDDEIEVIQLQNATAAEMVKTVTALNATTGAAAQATADGGQPLRVVSDDRTNSILLSGDKSARLRVKTLITYLDTPLQSGGNTQIRYLRYADAETLAKSLKEQIQGITQATAATAAPAGATPAASTTSSSASNSTSIWADKNTNALVVSAQPKIMQQIMAIVDKLDIRRAQVHVEAIVVELSATKTAELGVNWALYGSDGSNVPAAVFSGGNTNITDIATLALSDSISSLPTGTTLGIGRVVDSGASFAAILRALREDGNTNIISTPSIITLDNEEATIEVAQEVPFVTGQYSSTTTSGTSSSSVNPFQTISRESVGTKLKITPQINEGDSVRLTIEQEASSLGTQGDAVDLVTNKRSINTKVMVEDGGIIVLGGLLGDDLKETNSRVPILGSLPIIGNLFKARYSQKTKTNLMVFIRPTILRDGVQAAIETNSKYNLMRNQQLNINGGKVTLQTGEKQPTLPELVIKPGAAAAPAETGVVTTPLSGQ
ncbi:type II secretion system secretin GspD [Arenimonas sp.]|uniref:type II secretion system secretin GspD n=1 Tax=Arenimonas sp. TaxID=1872635 RepID=UPI0039E66F6F